MSRKRYFPTIRKINGIPRMFVDDVEMPTFLYRNRIHDDFEYMKKFVDTGYKLFFMTKIWPPEKAYSPEQYAAAVRNRICRVLDMAGDVFVILGYYLRIDKQWAEAHPEEMAWDTPEGPDMNPYGAASSNHIDVSPEDDVLENLYLSKKYGESMKYSLFSDKVRELQQSQANFHLDIVESLPDPDRVIGIFFEGGRAQEWYNYNSERYSPAMFRSYRAWLKKTYGSDEAYAEAYGENGLKIADAQMPSDETFMKPARGWMHDPDTPEGRANVDWWKFYAEDHAEMTLAGPEAVKARRPDMLCGFFCEHLHDCEHFTDPFEIIMKSPDVDFITGPIAMTPELGSPKLSHSLIASIHLHGKLWLQEEDNLPMAEHAGGCAAFLHGVEPEAGGLTEPEHYVEAISHIAAKDFTEGIHAWWWDFQARWFKSECYWRRLEKLQEADRIHRRKSPSSVAEVAILVSETAEHFHPHWARIIMQTTHHGIHFTFPFMGAPYQIYQLKDVGHPDFPVERIKTAIVIDGIVLSGEERKALRRLKGNDRTLVFYWASGFGNQDNKTSIYDVGNMEDLTGLKFREVEGPLTPVLLSLPGEHPICELYGSGRFFGMVDAFHKRKSRINNAGGWDSYFFVSINPVFIVEDDAAAPLAYYVVEKLPFSREYSDSTPAYIGAAIKNMGDWTSVYIGANYVQWELLNAILRASGVHTYLDSGDLVFADSNLVGVHGTGKSGARNIRLPKPMIGRDALLNGAGSFGPTKEISAEMGRYETRIFHLD